MAGTWSRSPEGTRARVAARPATAKASENPSQATTSTAAGSEVSHATGGTVGGLPVEVARSPGSPRLRCGPLVMVPIHWVIRLEVR
jgi:hypothetical protein